MFFNSKRFKWNAFISPWTQKKRSCKASRGKPSGVNMPDTSTRINNILWEWKTMQWEPLVRACGRWATANCADPVLPSSLMLDGWQTFTIRMREIKERALWLHSWKSEQLLVELYATKRVKDRLVVVGYPRDIFLNLAISEWLLCFSFQYKSFLCDSYVVSRKPAGKSEDSTKIPPFPVLQLCWCFLCSALV